MASRYRVELLLGDEIVRTRTVSSDVLKLNTPDTLTVTVSGMTESGTYTVRVTPIGIFGAEGTPLTDEATYESNLTADEMPAADILDIRPEGDTVKDFSPNGYEVTKKGTVKITETNRGLAMEFGGNGNFAVSGVKNHYAAMESGFTMEVIFTTPKDMSGFHSIASNMHAGGFGLDLENGILTFSVRVGSSYVGPEIPVEAETTYHMVGVFTGSSVKTYLNGTLMGETPVSGSLVHPTDNGAKYLCIGADSDATGAGEYGYTGFVYLVRMYTAAATEGQALYLYEQSAK